MKVKIRQIHLFPAIKICIVILSYLLPASENACQVFKPGWAISNVVDIICPLVGIRLTGLPNSGWAKVVLG